MKLKFAQIRPWLKSPIVVGLIGLFVVLVTMRSIIGPLFFHPHDSTHAARLVEMQRSLQAGEFPVRWSRNFGFGYGMPLFNFYAPLPYYLGQLPLLVGMSPIDAIKFLYYLNGVIAFTGMFLLGRKLWGHWGGLLSAVVFSFSSYRALDLFVRGAVGESFAMVLIPFALYGVQLAVEKKKSGPLMVAVSLAAIILSHNLTGLVTLGLVGIWWIFQLPIFKKSGRKAFLGLAATLVFAIALAAFYALPAFLEKGYTRVDQTITVGYFDYHNHFLCFSQLFKGQWKYGASLPGCSDDLSFSLGWVVWVLVGLSAVSVALWANRKERMLTTLILLLMAGSLFMTIGRSSFIWDHIALMKYFQFPWRFLAFGHVFAAASVGGVVLLVRRVNVSAVLIEGLVIALVYLHAQDYLPEKLQLPQDMQEFYDTSPTWIRTNISKTLNDYLPPRVRDDSLPFPVDSRFTVDKGTLSIAKDEPTMAVATVDCPDNCVLTINNFQFPGWAAQIDGRATNLLSVSNGLPIYTLPITKGNHNVAFSYQGTVLQTGSNLISPLALGVLAIWLALPILKKASRL